MTDHSRRNAHPIPKTLPLRQPARPPRQGQNVAICHGCDGFPSCRPDLPQWVAKKTVAHNLNVSLSTLCNRASRVGYTSPLRNAMPRRDQPKLCVWAEYFSLSAARARMSRRKTSKASRR